MTRRRGTEGFTLMEILVAFAIISVTLLVVFRSFQSGLEHERRAGEAQARVLEARSILAGIGATGRLIETVETGRLVTTGEPWQAEILPLQTAQAGPLQPWRVTLTVGREDQSGLTLTTVKVARR